MKLKFNAALLCGLSDCLCGDLGAYWRDSGLVYENKDIRHFVKGNVFAVVLKNGEAELVPRDIGTEDVCKPLTAFIPQESADPKKMSDKGRTYLWLQETEQPHKAMTRDAEYKTQELTMLYYPTDNMEYRKFWNRLIDDSPDPYGYVVKCTGTLGLSTIPPVKTDPVVSDGKVQFADDKGNVYDLTLKSFRTANIPPVAMVKNKNSEVVVTPRLAEPPTVVQPAAQSRLRKRAPSPLSADNASGSRRLAKDVNVASLNENKTYQSLTQGSASGSSVKPLSANQYQSMQALSVS